MTRHHSEGCEYGSVPEAAASDWANQYELTVPFPESRLTTDTFGWPDKKRRKVLVSNGRGGHPRRPGGRPGPRPL